MEYKILKTLEFNLSVTSSYRFLQRYASFLGANAQTTCLAQYLLELALVEYRMLKYCVSLKAAAALYLSDRLLNKDALWDVKIGEQIGYKEMALKGCAKEMVLMMQVACKSALQAVRKKFSYQKYLGVAKLRIAKKE